MKCYKSILDIEDKIDMAVIAVKAEFVPGVVEECGKKNVKNVIIISSGFKELGKIELDKKLQAVLEKYKIRCIGPNCLGIYDSFSELDAIFLPEQKVKRPKQGSISFLSQSGALGAALIDSAAERNYGISKFISYGNAMNLNESDFLEYLGQDQETKVICLYIEQVKDSRFLEIVKKISKIKPLIVFKGGMTEQGSKAVLSHTGSLAGSPEIYRGILRQAKAIQVDMLEDLFSVARILEKFIGFKVSDKIQVITNGGGFGIICSDQIIKNSLELAEMSSKTKQELKKKMPPIVNVSNPLDLMGDVTNQRYKDAIDACLEDSNIDVILLVLLYQTPAISEEVLDIILEASNKNKKPMVVIATGSSSSYGPIAEELEKRDLICFRYPEQAIRALKKALEYIKKD